MSTKKDLLHDACEKAAESAIGFSHNIAKRIPVSYDPLYTLDQADPRQPKIVRVEEESGGTMTFWAAKEELLQVIRYHRDHWACMLRDAKKLTIGDVQ